jgi:hypothetical protein
MKANQAGEQRNYKRSVSFLDTDGHRATVKCEITHRNGYPEFTATGEFLGSWGQCLDSIKPRTELQTKLVNLWKNHHLEDTSHLPNFEDALDRTLDAIEGAEDEEIKLTSESTDAQFLKQMGEYGIDEDSLDACKAYIEVMGVTDLRDFEEAYCGEFADPGEFAQDMAESCGDLDRDMRWPYNHIDWHEAALELMQDYCEQDGFFFRNS